MIPGGNLLLAGRPRIVITYSGAQYNRTFLTDARNATYATPVWDGISAADFVVTNSGTAGSTSTGAYALQTGSGYPAGSALSFTNNGRVEGAGGPGGSGGGFGSGGNGGTGGPALRLDFPTALTNNGQLWAGGGGGGGAGGDGYNGTNGGGGGAGDQGGPGGTGVTGLATGVTTVPGSTGTPTAGGAPGTGGNTGGGTGGGPGLPGTDGATGPDDPATLHGGTGGPAGNYIVGNSFATWLATGDRRGGVA